MKSFHYSSSSQNSLRTKPLFALFATTTVQLRCRPAAVAVRCASLPPSRHPLSSIKSSSLAKGEFEKWIFLRIFFYVFDSFVLLWDSRFRVQNTPLPCHEETPQAKKCLYHRNPPLNQMAVTVVNEVATNLTNFVVIIAALEPLVVATCVHSDDMCVSRRLTSHCDEKLSCLPATTAAARAPDFVLNDFGSH